MAPQPDELTSHGPIGFVGLGQMGLPMARRLADRGHRVLGFDVATGTAELLAGSGVELAPDLSNLGRRCRAVILMLPGSDIVELVLTGSGLLGALEPGSLVIDMSSSEPRRTRELAVLATSRGIDLVDAPVSGGVTGAQRGTLTAMVGGARQAVNRAQPVLGVLAARVVHAGEVGSGHAVKALNNLMSATHLLATSEALLAGRAFGLDVATILDIVNGSSGRSGSTDNKWPNFILPQTYDSGFNLRLMLKDMRIALELAHEAGVPAALSEASVQLWATAADELDPAADHTEIARWIEARARRGESEELGADVCR
jgi:3-hydroxyisobutyrate dehydrogenase